MTLLDLLLLIVIAAVIGAIGQAVAGYSAGGCLVSIVVGLVGALLGAWLARLLELPTLFVVSVDGHAFPVIWSIVGAALFVALLRLISGNKRVRY